MDGVNTNHCTVCPAMVGVYTIHGFVCVGYVLSYLTPVRSHNMCYAMHPPHDVPVSRRSVPHVLSLLCVRYVDSCLFYVLLCCIIRLSSLRVVSVFHVFVWVYVHAICPAR